MSLEVRTVFVRQIAQRAAAWLRGPDAPEELSPAPVRCAPEELALQVSEARVVEATDSLQPVGLARHTAALSADRFRHAQQYWLLLRAKTGAIEGVAEPGGPGPISFPDSMPDYPFGVPHRAQAEARQARSQAAVTRSLAEHDRAAYREMGGDRALRAAKAHVDAALMQRDDARIALQRCRQGLDN